MYQTTIGAHNHRSSRGNAPPIHLPPAVKMLPEHFKQAGYYTVTAAGRKRLARQKAEWARMTAIMHTVLNDLG